MHKYLLCAGLLAAAPLVRAQSPGPLSAATGRFCVVRSAGVLDDSRPNFTADYGQAAKKARLPGAENPADSFRKENLHSVADLLDYMDRTGWELLQTAAVSGGNSGATNPLVEYQYIFRRKADQ
ncbi:MAG: hypothetical protein EOO59_19535 [Hymenobacter sp.]|nr:MAG: hypothetical protein EOO59_19535 [Hymenobacter sp.]